MLAHVKGYDYNYEKVPDVVGKFMSDLFVIRYVVHLCPIMECLVG